jgi:hypothetical protein
MSAGSLTSTAGGAVNETGAITVAGPTSIAAGANSITLTAANDFQGPVSLTGGATQIRDINELTLGSVNVSALSVTTSGNITQSGAVSVSGASNLQAGGGSISLADVSNEFGGRIDVSAGGDIFIQDASDIVVGTINSASGVVNLRAPNGDLIAAVPGSSSVSAGHAAPADSIFESTGGADGQVTGIGINIPHNLTVTGSATLWNFTAGSSAGSFSRTSETIGVQVGGVTFLASLVQIQAGNIVASVSASAAAVIVEEANRTFGTDSVAEAVEYGFAGEIGATPPMDHRIDESGISLPHCVEESRDGLPCK